MKLSANHRQFTLQSCLEIHLCLEVDPMLECFLVVQWDPQVMPIINEVVLGSPRHFSFKYSHSTPPQKPVDDLRDKKAGRFTGGIKSKKNNSRSDQWMFSIAVQRPDATTPPVTAANWRQQLPRRSDKLLPR